MRSQNRRSFVRSMSLAIAAAIATLFTLAAPVTSMAGPSEDAPRPGRIAGIVVNSERQPVAGAQVALINAAGEVVRRTETSAEGRYMFERVHPGPWLVRARKVDIGIGQERTAVRPGETVRVPVMLRRP
ncbi:MAG: carboxypeptidase regulatory-like domain-containing protein [Phycisphaerales bacterium]|nr:carboxypeptidase regulatory-like domain-containing protein [Phycisphaerales bacterium]